MVCLEKVGCQRKNTCNFTVMRQNFSARVIYDGKTVSAIILPQHRKDGMYYEINIQGIERFYMHWSASDRYDVVPTNKKNVYDMLFPSIKNLALQIVGSENKQIIENCQAVAV